jgi:hypothetical protein
MKRIAIVWLTLIFVVVTQAEMVAEAKELRAGSWSVDASPLEFPVLVNGSFLANQANSVLDPIKAKCLVLDDGETKLAIVVVDVCMMPRELVDKAKTLAQEKTGIPTDRMLVSATHTHSAPACGPALGTPPDPTYVKLLPGRIAAAIIEAAARLEPAEIGWAVIDDPEHTHNRRWIRRPDKMINDPFGDRTVRANMHPGHVNPDAIAPSGPVDPGLTVVSVRRKGGRPLAVLANYSMHYFGTQPVSADYYGRFCDRLATRLAGNTPDERPVVIMSQGTSGDLMWMDYGKPKNDPGIDRYADEVVQAAFKAYKTIQYQDQAPLAMAETTLTLGRRLPDAKRLAWAREINAKRGDREPKSIPEVYAKEAVLIDAEPKRELKLQAIRIGNLGITAIPNEVYAITGLKLKAQSPLQTTMNIELANGGDGYIPPPEQHALGGYTTWPARTAGLEVQAEPRIVETVLSLLEKVSGKSRKAVEAPRTRYTDAVLASKPVAYWRLDDMAGSTPHDFSGHMKQAKLEPGFALYLPGADGPGLTGTSGQIDRAVHLAGGRLKAEIDGQGGASSVELWFWNGLPVDARPVTGVLLSVGESANADIIAISGKGSAFGEGRLTYANGTSAPVAAGKSEIPLKTWNQIVLVRESGRVSIYLNGNPQPELMAESKAGRSGNSPIPLIVGDGGDRKSSFEGKIDEVAVYDRALSPDEIASHYRAAMNPAP